MKRTLSLLLILLTTIGYAQNRQSILGTKYAMIPPSGFEPATNFSGFHNPSLGASIMISELSAPAQKMTEAFTPEALKKQGVHIVEKKKVKMDTIQATYVIGTQVANGIQYHKQILVFGNSNRTTIVNAVYPETLKVKK